MEFVVCYRNGKILEYDSHHGSFTIGDSGALWVYDSAGNILKVYSPRTWKNVKNLDNSQAH